MLLELILRDFFTESYCRMTVWNALKESRRTVDRVTHGNERRREREREKNREEQTGRWRWTRRRVSNAAAGPLEASIQRWIVTVQRPLADPADDLYDPLCRSTRVSHFSFLFRAIHYFPNCFVHSASCPPEERSCTPPRRADVELIPIIGFDCVYTWIDIVGPLARHLVPLSILMRR